VDGRATTRSARRIDTHTHRRTTYGVRGGRSESVLTVRNVMSDAEFDPIIDLLDRIDELNNKEDTLLEDLTITQEALIECLTQLDIETGEEAS